MENSREIEIRQQIDAYVKGQLSEEQIQELWNEFARNPELLDVLEIEVNVKEIIERESRNSKGANINKLPSWTWHAAAAAVVLIVAMVQLFQVNTPTELDQFIVQRIEPGQLETSDGVRSSKDMKITTADSLLNLGFEAVISGNESRALELFDEVISRFDEEPYGSKAFLNKGIVLYNESDYNEAISAFKDALSRVEESHMIAEKAYWYLGNALINIEELEDARSAIYEAYKLQGIFRKPAFRLLKKLSNDLGNTDYEEFDAEQLD